MSDNLKLYVWPAFMPDYSDGLAFAIAASEEEARAAVENVLGWDGGNYGPVEVHELNRGVSFACPGGA